MQKKYGSNWKDSSSAKNDDSYTAAMYGAQWVDQWVTDCSGLFYWAFKELGGYMYHGSNTMWSKYCTSKGKLSKGKRTDG
jgi:cell wall-associated NlpC family hydrolase